MEYFMDFWFGTHVFSYSLLYNFILIDLVWSSRLQSIIHRVTRVSLTGTGISCKEKIARKIFKCVYLFLFIITKLFLKSLLLFKLNSLMVPIGKKPAPGDHKSCLKLFLAKCPCLVIIGLFYLKLINISRTIQVLIVSYDLIYVHIRIPLYLLVL